MGVHHIPSAQDPPDREERHSRSFVDARTAFRSVPRTSNRAVGRYRASDTSAPVEVTGDHVLRDIERGSRMRMESAVPGAGAHHRRADREPGARRSQTVVRPRGKDHRHGSPTISRSQRPVRHADRGTTGPTGCAGPTAGWSICPGCTALHRMPNWWWSTLGLRLAVTTRELAARLTTVRPDVRRVGEIDPHRVETARADRGDGTVEFRVGGSSSPPVFAQLGARVHVRAKVPRGCGDRGLASHVSGWRRLDSSSTAPVMSWPRGCWHNGPRWPAGASRWRCGPASIERPSDLAVRAAAQPR